MSIPPSQPPQAHAVSEEIAERIVIDYANCSGRETAHRAEFREMVRKHLSQHAAAVRVQTIEEIRQKVEEKAHEFVTQYLVKQPLMPEEQELSDKLGLDQTYLIREEILRVFAKMLLSTKEANLTSYMSMNRPTCPKCNEGDLMQWDDRTVVICSSCHERFSLDCPEREGGQCTAGDNQ